jgi:anaerobic selenocysteine-containing dehydrogenase
LIGKPGSTVFQMNGQPTAQNTRECGANGELAAFLNFDNEAHLQRLADHWRVDPGKITFHAPPTHIMQMMRYAEEGSLRMLWITATNPAVTLPHLDRVRKILGKSSLFVVVQDAFETETTQLADVVLPAALWAEKTGTFTNADRTVHISHRAIDPPVEARTDLDILIDFARRMDLRDRDGTPLVKWSTPEQAFEHFKELTRGRPCDYSGLSYGKLSEGSGIQWPCNEQYPSGRARLYEDGVFHTGVDDCETYGHDLVTGAAYTRDEYAAHDPRGRAHLRAAEYVPPLEQPDTKYPLMLTTGRVVYHFHTRTKTWRSRELREAAPEPRLSIAKEDAERRGIADGDWVEVTSRRASVRARASIDEILAGHLFLSFHFGTWDDPERASAANELTLDSWDPVSKQPRFKHAAMRIRKLRGSR